jgi:hypothetical protein
MPEVQKSVLEHAPSEAQNSQVTGSKLAQNDCIDNSVTTEDLVRKTDTKRVAGYTFEVSESRLENPDRIRGVTVQLPSGLAAWFCRVEDWKPVSM